MDIPRPERKRQKRIRQALLGAAGAVVLGVVTVVLARLEPAAPSVLEGSVWIGTVEQGEMLRQVRGPGTLVPRNIRWIGARTEGRVERVLVRPGAVVDADTVLVEMSNPDLMEQAEAAKYNLEAAEAELAEMELNLRSEQLDHRAALAVAKAEYESAQLQAEAELDLTDEGIVPAIQSRRSQLLAEQMKIRMEIQQERLDQFSASVEAQIAARKAQVAAVRSTYERRLDEIDSLDVRAGFAGVLQEMLVEEGQRLPLGANIARVARPDDLQAELRVAETQARDVQIGQHVDVDTRNGIVAGKVIRIDPAVQQGTVQVDVELVGKLPRGARPDQSVDGTIEIERLDNVVYMGRPVIGQSNQQVKLFKVTEDGYAIQVPVQLGVMSVSEVEIVQGLVPGDRVILSDTSAWDEHDRIRLN